jgi:hypothetical protein
MTAKKNWKLDWYDAVASDKRVDPAAFKVAYCMRRNISRRTLAAKIEDKVLSKMTGISVAGVKRARKPLERRGWITEWIEPNAYSFMGDYLAEQRDADQRKNDPTAAQC